MEQSSAVVLNGLTKAELLDLESQLGPDNVQREQLDRGREDFAALDPISAVVIITVANHAILALWIVKNRKRKGKEVFTIRHSDGTVETREIITEEEEKSDAAVIDSVTNQFKTWLGLIPPSG